MKQLRLGGLAFVAALCLSVASANAYTFSPPSIPAVTVPAVPDTTYCTAPTPSGCMAWQTVKAASAWSALQRYYADYQKLQYIYTKLQMAQANVAQLQGLSFSSWPQVLQQLTSSNGGGIQSLDPNFAQNVMQQVYGQQQNDSQQLASLEALAPTIQGTTGAVSLNASISALQVGAQQQQMLAQQAQAIQRGQMAQYGLGLSASMFDLNGDPNAGFGW